jgi:isoleucyl-tRNA synthetase
MSALLPLISEQIYQGLTLNNFASGDSIHLQDFPEVDFKVDETLVSDMDKVLEICQAGLYIRNAENIRVRQPLRKANIILKDLGNVSNFEDLIRDELNVKEVEFSDNLKEHAELKLSINFKILGSRLPQHMKDIIVASKKGDWSNVDNLLVVGGHELKESEYEIVLDPHAKGSAKNLSSNDGIVMFDLNIDRGLLLEGMARDVIRLVQQSRKNQDFNISDNIRLEYNASGDLLEAINTHKNFIEEQTLSKMQKFDGQDHGFSENIADIKIDIRLSID